MSTALPLASSMPLGSTAVAPVAATAVPRSSATPLAPKAQANLSAPLTADSSAAHLKMDEAFSYGELHKYRENLGTYALRVGLHVVPAIALGLAIDKIIQKLQEKYELRPLTVIVIQLIVLILVLFIVERISRKYADEWQNNTPGLFFSAFLFGTQSNLYSNIAAFGKQIAREDR